MPTPLEVGTRHQRSRIRLANDATERALSKWRTADLAYLEASWTVIAPVLVDQVSEAQVVAAGQSDAYTDEALQSSGGGARPGAIVPEAFAGVMIDGREVGPAMYGAVTTTKALIGGGLRAARAFEAGAAFLATIVQSAIADTGRQSDRVSAIAKHVDRYVRVVQQGACSRCAVLAGTASYQTAFLRHPNCHCTAQPLVDGKVPPGFFSTSDEYFHSLSHDEQDRVFTAAGAESIRNGADLNAIVNARRGAPLRPGGPVEHRSGLSAPLGYAPDGQRIRVYTTGEGTTRRGAFGRAELRRKEELKKASGDRYRRTTNLRLMPETIVQMAAGDTVKLQQLLTQYGYIS